MAKLVSVMPKVSEKSYGLAEQLNTYVFVVPADANKHSVAQAIAAQYEVEVLNVRIAGVPGKVKRSYRRGGRNVFKGSRSGLRKAYVTLKEGDKLPIFTAVEEPVVPDKETK